MCINITVQGEPEPEPEPEPTPTPSTSPNAIVLAIGLIGATVAYVTFTSPPLKSTKRKGKKR